jgi:WD40 repeat protein
MDRCSNISDRSIAGAVFAPIDDVLVMTRYDEPVSVWHGRTGAAVRVLPTSDSEEDVAFSRDGSLLALSSGRRTRVWDTDSWKVVASVRGWFADFSRDGRLVLTVMPDGSAHVWEAGSGEAVSTIAWPALLNRPVFGSDGRSIISAGDDGVVRTLRCPACGDIVAVLADAGRRLAPRP